MQEADAQWNRITDEFAVLCDGADPGPIYQQHGIDFAFWTLGALAS